MSANEDPRALAELLWGLRKPHTRGPRPAFDLAQLADTAVKVADTLEAVSMHRVAAELGLTKMALYRYVNGKTELMAIMIEAAVAHPRPERGGRLAGQAGRSTPADCPPPGGATPGCRRSPWATASWDHVRPLAQTALSALTDTPLTDANGSTRS